MSNKPTLKVHSTDNAATLFMTCIFVLRERMNWTEPQITALCDELGWKRGFGSKNFLKFVANNTVEDIVTKLSIHIDFE